MEDAEQVSSMFHPQRSALRHLSAFALALSLVLTGCGPDLVDERAEWHAKAPDAYVVGTCSTGFTLPACKLSAVEHGQVLQAEVETSADGSWAAIDKPSEPIEALFASAEGLSDDCELSIDFDDTFSYPTQVYFDCGAEGWGERVLCFTPGSVDLESCRGSTAW
jgi:hypothetical protein